jgi:choice-of-anchor C domain-containing protein
MHRIRILLGAVLALAAPLAPAANLVVNGDFEQPAAPPGGFLSYGAGQDVGGWTVEGAGVDVVHGFFWQPARGIQSLDLSGEGPGGIRQTIATEAGRTYELAFAHAGNFGCGAAQKQLEVRWNGSVVGQVAFDTTGSSANTMRWRRARALRLPGGGDGELVLRAIAPAGACGPTLDRIELSERVTSYRDLRLVSRARDAVATGDGASTLESPRTVASADGRWLAFVSAATDLVGDDANAHHDVYLADLARGTVAAISRTPAGAFGDQDSYEPHVSGDGRWVLFASAATNLDPVAPPTGGQQSLYLHDREAGTSRLVSLNAAGTAGSEVLTNNSGLSDDGRYVLMTSYATDLVAPPTTADRAHVYQRDMLTGTTRLVTRAIDGVADGNQHTFAARMSRDGRYIAYATLATNLVAAVDANAALDVFLWDRELGSSRLVSRTSGGMAGNGASRLSGISDDGARVFFESTASDLVAGDGNGAADLFVFDTATGGVQLAACTGPCTSTIAGGARDGHATGNGSHLLFVASGDGWVVGDTDGARDLFVRDLATGAVALVSPDVEGAFYLQPNAISPDGRRVLFTSEAAITADDANGDLNDLYLHDRDSGRTQLVTRGEFGSAGGVEAATFAGPWIAFASAAANLTVEADANAGEDVFVVRQADFDRVFGDGFE